MAGRQKTDLRLASIIRAYLDDLAKLGAYGKGRAGVMRRFIENGIKDAIEKGVIAPRDVSEFDGGDEEREED
jgi:hypothetical protein